jgi:predicted metal-dependent hydrolase
MGLSNWSAPDWLKSNSAPSVTVGDRVLPVVVRRLRQARRFTLRLAPDGSEVRLSIPWAARSADALAFARGQTDWLAGQLARVPEGRPPGPGDTVPYRGADLLLAHRPGTPRRPRLTGAVLELGGQLESVPRRVRTWLESEARRLLAEDLADYCARVSMAPAPLALSNARRRWGSCSARGAVRINWRLVMASDAVRRSVVAHEVAHLVHFDHGPGFRALLTELYEGDLPAADRWLKRDGRTLYLPFG